MAFPTNPSPGDSYTDEYGTVWVYAGTVNGWYRQTVTTPNDTSYTAAISEPAGSNTQVQFNDNGKLAGDNGLTYNKTTDALSGGAFIPTGSTAPTNGLYQPSTNTVALSTNGTGRLFIDASGNVGIGAPSSITGLELSGNIQIKYAGVNSEPDGASYLIFNNTDTTLVNDQPLGGISWVNNDAGATAGQAAFFKAYTASNTGAAYLTFGTGGQNAATERLRITSAGFVGIGVNPAYQLQLATDSAGKPSTNTWTIVSDERIKEEIELADLDLCYEAVKNIPLKRFKWKDEVYTEEQAYDRRKLGWIAQDVEAVFPKAVRQHEFKYNQIFEEVVIPAVPAELDDDGNIITEEQPERIEKGELISEEVIEDCRDLNSDQLYAAMYGAIQKLISKVELLEAEVQALKAA